MQKVYSVKHIGMRRAYALANLSEDQQFDLIAEGLPILMNSAGNLFKAAYTLAADHPRSASILQYLSFEEVAKILILIDMVRCPSSFRPSLIGKMMKWFYNHLARLIYIEVQSMKPAHARELQKYIDSSRHTHYLEGEFGEYIMPNSKSYCREKSIYADIVLAGKTERCFGAIRSRPATILLFGLSLVSLGKYAKRLRHLAHFLAKVSIWFQVLGVMLILLAAKITGMPKDSLMK